MPKSRPAKPAASPSRSNATRASKVTAPRVGYSERRRIDKLGVKPGMRVGILGVADAFIRRELEARTENVFEDRLRPNCELVLFEVGTLRDLERLKTLRSKIAKNGAIWAIWRKGVPELKEDHIRAAALRQGLVDVKVIAFSETLSALKLVIPLAQR